MKGNIKASRQKNRIWRIREGTKRAQKVMSQKTGVRLHKVQFRAAFTIEAALIFPFILSVIVLIIYFAFFIHDRAVLDAAAYQAALRGSEVTDPYDDIYAKVKNMGEEAIADRLLSTRNVDMDIEITKDEVAVRYSGEFVIPGGTVLIPLLSFSGLGVRAEGHSTRLDPTGFLRECRMIENLGDYKPKK